VDPKIASPSGLLPQRFDDASESSIASQFGESFKDSLFALEVDDWTGPVESPFGMHLIKIDNLVQRRVPALAEIRAVAEREWRVDRRDAAQQAFFDQLRAKYVITIEEIDTSSP
jgi:parvulin-like peptidyl-prolyl isomerase